MSLVHLPIGPELVHFSFELTPDSSLRASIAGISGSERLKEANLSKVALECSTADIHFGSVSISTQ